MRQPQTLLEDAGKAAASGKKQLPERKARKADSHNEEL
jgi:hypothetical protein